MWDKAFNQLQTQKLQLILQEQQLRKCEELNESEQRKLDLQKEMVRKEAYIKIYFLQVVINISESRDDTLKVSEILQFFL